MKTNKTIAVAMLCISSVGCNRFIQEAMQQASNVGSNSAVQPNLRVAMTVKRDGVTLLDSTTSTNTFFSAIQGQRLSLRAKVLNCLPGSTVNLKVLNTWAVNNSISNINGSNCEVTGEVVAAAPGVYDLTVSVRNPSGQESAVTYNANVSCASPTFTADSLNSNAIAVSGEYARTSFNASGVVASANGQAPYRCAFDFNGDGIVDSVLKPCEQSQTALSTYVLSRKINVVVADACNAAYVVSKNIALPKTSPAIPQDVFIEGLTSQATGCAAVARAKDVSYLAHNINGVKPCDAVYANGTFSIECKQNYALPYSQVFGMKISVTGLGQYDIRTNPGTIDYANAKVSGISYSTDEGGDSAPRLAFEGAGSNCISSITASVQNPVLAPCGAGQSGTSNRATIQVGGSYTCSNVKNACGSITISGKFSGMFDLVDGCAGGGQGGGGDPVPSF